MKAHRYKSLDILKGLAMIMVILVHYNQSFSSNIKLFRFGQMGCQIFFVMSGLGISFSLSKRFDSNNWGRKELLSYYKSRVEKIAPAYYFMIVAVFLINTILLHFFNHSLLFGTNRSIFGILCNVFFVHGLIPSANNNVVAGGWYIGTSMLLYLVAPFLFDVFYRFPKRRRTICVVISVLSVAGLYALTRIVPEQYKLNLVGNNSFGYFSILTQLPCFALGILMFFEIRENEIENVIFNVVLGIVILAGSIVLFFKPFFEFSYIVTASTVGLATFFITKGFIGIEAKRELAYSYRYITQIGQKSLFVFLTHAFFAWPFVAIIKKGAILLGVQADNYFVYFLLFPIVVFLSYVSGLILEIAVNMLVKHLLKKDIVPHR